MAGLTTSLRQSDVLDMKMEVLKTLNYRLLRVTPYELLMKGNPTDMELDLLRLRSLEPFTDRTPEEVVEFIRERDHVNFVRDISNSHFFLARLARRIYS